MDFLLYSALAACIYFADATEDARLKVQVTTWNVNHKPPPDDVTPLLGLDRQPDIIAVGLQEVSISPHEAIINAIFIDRWTKAIDATVEPKGYTKIRTVAMVGIILNVYALDRHNFKISIIDHARVRTGWKGLYGNKGGVALTFLLYGSPVTFVAAHLAPSEANQERRIEDYQVIEKRRGRSCSQEDYTFWLGDFNFRLMNEGTYTADKIQYLLQKGNLAELRKQDELTVIKEQGRIFKGYEEQPVTFKPTYRFYVGTNNYDLQRRPAWTDRILYRGGPGRDITPLHYGVIANMELSDHKPVEAVFLIAVPM